MNPQSWEQCLAIINSCRIELIGCVSQGSAEKHNQQDIYYLSISLSLDLSIYRSSLIIYLSSVNRIIYYQQLIHVIRQNEKSQDVLEQLARDQES